jgi:hypothetical protein
LGGLTIEEALQETAARRFDDFGDVDGGRRDELILQFSDGAGVRQRRLLVLLARMQERNPQGLRVCGSSRSIWRQSLVRRPQVRRTQAVVQSWAEQANAGRLQRAVHVHRLPAKAPMHTESTPRATLILPPPLHTNSLQLHTKKLSKKNSLSIPKGRNLKGRGKIFLKQKPKTVAAQL